MTAVLTRKFVDQGKGGHAAAIGKLIFWATLNIAVIDLRTAILLAVTVVGIGLGVLMSLAGSDYL